MYRPDHMIKKDNEPCKQPQTLDKINGGLDFYRTFHVRWSCVNEGKSADGENNNPDTNANAYIAPGVLSPLFIILSFLKPILPKNGPRFKAIGYEKDRSSRCASLAVTDRYRGRKLVVPRFESIP